MTREQLAAWSRGSGRRALRARIDLACAEPGAVNEHVAATLRVSTLTVGKWRQGFASAGLPGLSDGKRPARPKAELVLSDAERDQLTRWARPAKSAQALARRSRIVLACGRGMDNKHVAAELGVTEGTVACWRGRFLRRRLESPPAPGTRVRSLWCRSS